MSLDRVGFDDFREWATAKAKGRILEVGAGSGLNFSYYGPEVQVIAFDPDPEMLDEVKAARKSHARISVMRASAMQIPFSDETFDAVVGTLVFCTIPDARLALAEVKRVMKNGASLRLVEHVRPENAVAGSVMDAITPLWRRVAGGCHLNRHTLDTVLEAGFGIDSLREKWFGLVIGIESHK